LRAPANSTKLVELIHEAPARTLPRSAGWARRDLRAVRDPARATRGISFADPSNLETLLRQTTIVATAALGMTAVIVAGGIDLSVGAVIALVTVVVAATLRAGAPPLVAALAGVGTGLATGIVNGALVTRLRVVPFIVTLGTMLLIRGAAKGSHTTEDRRARLVAGRSAGAHGRCPRLDIAARGVWVLLLLALATAALLSRTRPGRYIFAVGSNEEASRLAGVPVARVKVLVYALGGLGAGVAGLMQFSRLTVAIPRARRAWSWTHRRGGDRRRQLTAVRGRWRAR